MTRWILWLSCWLCLPAWLGCAVVEEGREGRQEHHLPPLPPRCDAWRLFMAGRGGLAQVTHPWSSVPAEVDPRAFVDVAAGGDGALYGAVDGGVWRSTEGDPDDGTMLLAAGAFPGLSALAYDPVMDRLHLATDLGLVALDPPEGDTGLSVLRLWWPPDGAHYDALVTTPAGGLFASTTYGGGRSAIVHFARPLATDDDAAIFWSDQWGPITDLAYGVDGSLYVTDGGPTVFVVDNPERQSGPVAPTKVITIEGTELSGALIGPDGVGYLTDDAAGRLIAVPNLSDAYPQTSPSWSIARRGVRRLALLPPCDTPQR